MKKLDINEKNRGTIRTAVFLIINTILVFSLYRITLAYADKTDNTYPAFLVFVAYLSALFVLGLAFLIYNRFFYAKGLTAADLSADWSEEQKEAFLRKRDERLRKSRWMLFLIIPLLFNFLIDAVDLYFFNGIL